MERLGDNLGGGTLPRHERMRSHIGTLKRRHRRICAPVELVEIDDAPGVIEAGARKLAFNGPFMRVDRLQRPAGILERVKSL